MTLIYERPYKKHESAIFIREDLKVKSISIRDEGNIEIITVELPGVVHSVYKAPTERIFLPALGHINLPHIVIWIATA